VLSAILRHAGEVFALCFGLVLAGLLVSRIHFWLGSAAVLLSVLCYMLANVIVRSQSARTRQAMLTENQRLGQLSQVDGLTGIANRRRFDERLHLELDTAKRSGQPLSLLMIDVDQFKEFNDSQGHLAGDSCLTQIASAISGALTRATDLAARYGGEEFAVILPMTSQEGAVKVADAIRVAVLGIAREHPASPFGRVTVSIGVATASIGVATASCAGGCLSTVLIGAADRALYRAKAQGRNRSECEPVGQEAPPEVIRALDKLSESGADG
jgi:diguanylate cyclase (GGDEF)-like protein